MRLDHVGVVVQDLEEFVDRLTAGLGGARREVSDPTHGHLKVVFVDFPNCSVEVIEPIDSSHPNAGWLREHGPGVQHLAFEVDDMSAPGSALATIGIALGRSFPAAGGGTAWTFASDSFGGPLIHLVERD
jgi:methylmalonyl-CoA/ethylmalonyl-CoA epimerase